MKNKTLFYKMLLYIGIIFIIVMLILFVLGRIDREGYLSNLSINADNTLKLNNIDVENTKKLFYSDDELDYSSLTNYIFTNPSISKYSYNFRISYYSKVFGNSDIYGVYLNTNSLPNYISDIKFHEKGSPFGILLSSKIIEQEKIDNIEYSLKIKYSFSIIAIILICLCFILFYNFNFIIIDFIKLISNIKLLKRINLKNKYVYILVIFLCFLIIPNIVYKIFDNRFDHNNYENRNLNLRPILSLTNIFNYPKEYEAYFNDYIPFRNELVKIKSLIDIIVFNNSIGKDRTIGKDKWVFAKWKIDDIYMGKEYTYFNSKELEQAKSNLLHFRNELKKRNIDFILMICNDKQFIYDNYMPNYMNKKTNITSTDQFVEYISKETDIEIIYTKDEFMKYKNDYQLYYKYDSHWNYLGGYVAYTQILQKISNSYIPIDEVYFKDISLNGKSSDGNTDQYNDLSRAFALSKTKFYNDDKRYIISGYSFDNYDKINVIDWANFTTISKKPLNNIYLFMLRDSYGSAMVPYISTSFNKVTYAHFRNFKITDLNNISPNLFIFEIVERGLKNYVLKTIPNYKIEEINKDLETNFISNNN